MSSADRVMLDLETLGLEPGCAILSIGAVRFGTDGLGEEFYTVVDVESCQDAGLSIDADTLDWWLGQDEAAREVLRGGVELRKALESFSRWFADAEELWANPPAFDCMILGAAYDAVEITRPWEYYEQRDARTVRKLPCAVGVEMDGVEHNALDDATHQAREVAGTLRRLKADGGPDA